MARVVLDSDDDSTEDEKLTTNQQDCSEEELAVNVAVQGTNSSEKLRHAIKTAQLALAEPTPPQQEQGGNSNDASESLKSTHTSKTPAQAVNKDEIITVSSDDPQDVTARLHRGGDASPHDTVMDTSSHSATSSSRLHLDIPKPDDASVGSRALDLEHDDGKPVVSPLSEQGHEGLELQEKQTNGPVVMITSRSNAKETLDEIPETCGPRKRKLNDQVVDVDPLTIPNEIYIPRPTRSRGSRSMQDLDVNNSTSSPSRKSSSRASKRRKVSNEPEVSAHVQNLCEMGFTQPAAEQALTKASGDFDAAVELLVSRGSQSHADIEYKDDLSTSATKLQENADGKADTHANYSNEAMAINEGDQGQQDAQSSSHRTRRRRGRPKNNSSRSAVDADLEDQDQRKNADEAETLNPSTIKELQKDANESEKTKRKFRDQGPTKYTKHTEDENEVNGTDVPSAEDMSSADVRDEQDKKAVVREVLQDVDQNHSNMMEHIPHSAVAKEFANNLVGQEEQCKLKDNMQLADTKQEIPGPQLAIAGSNINAGKVPLKVGLSKRARIEPLLRVFRK